MAASRTKSKGLTTQEMHARWPLLKSLAGPPGDAEGEDAWLASFDARPDVMHGVLQDLIKQTHSKPGRVGQRPMPREEEVDLDGLIYGEDNSEPLVDILPRLITVSERAFCNKIAMSRSTFQRMLRGRYHPDAAELRQIAAAVGKPPTFFVEYRKLMAVTAFVKLIEERPNIATRLYWGYLTVNAGT